MQRAAYRAVASTVKRSQTLYYRNAIRNASSPGTRSIANTASSSSTVSGSSISAASNAAKQQQSSYLGKITVVILSSLVFSGAWLTYKRSEPFLTQISLDNSIGDQRAFSTSTKDDVRVRKIVAVDHESLYTGTVQGDGPLTKDMDGQGGRKVLEMLSPEEATHKLRQTEESYLVGRDQGVYRYDVVQVPSNTPIEDDHSERIIEVPGTLAAADEGRATTDWMFWGVFDGHSGWVTSAKLRQLLIGFVARELNATYKASSTDPASKMPTPESIDSAIKKGFLRLDHEITHESVEKLMKNPSKSAAAEILAPALAGSCALLAFYDSQTSLLRVAVTGDSRAVLGRLQEDGKWTATALSVDQTGSNGDEAARMRAEHPGEDYVIRNGRVLGGLEPTRAFGDAVYKWGIDTQNMIKSKYFGKTPSPLLRTPPYVTAEPVVTTTKINPQKGDFLVLATDGLWEMLSNEDVVGLVAKWLESQNKAKASSAASTSWFASLFGWGKEESKLPISETLHDAAGQRQPIRQRQWGLSGSDTRFVVEDENCATHLVRNALGGKDTDLVCALLTLQSPYSRRYRDDLTVEVIFFGEGDKSGNVIMNEKASSKNKLQN